MPADAGIILGLRGPLDQWGRGHINNYIWVTSLSGITIKPTYIMGMICNLLRVTRTELAAYIKDSSALEHRIYDNDTDSEDPFLTDIDKTWDGIMFLLTGKSSMDGDPPTIKIFFSGQAIDEEQDMGYGPADYRTPEQVKAISNQLSGISIEDLREKYDSDKMTELEVYPAIWDNSSEITDYLIDSFITVREVYATAAENDEAIICFIN